jgi:hypothetical protein
MLQTRQGAELALETVDLGRHAAWHEERLDRDRALLLQVAARKTTPMPPWPMRVLR